jgi:predicted dehydrogenase
MSVINVGIVGCGFISDIYLSRMSRTFKILEVKACADKDPDRAARKAKSYGIAALGVEELIQDDGIDLIINLTNPRSHASITLAALRAGKHVFSEKPLAADRKEAREIVELALEKNLRVGAAPDTFLGAGIQTSLRLLDTGAIGEPFGVSGTLLVPGHERWHPNPAFYYQRGGGPMLDMGPYYLTAMIAMLGPVRSVAAMASKPRESRTIARGPKRGQPIEVEVPTYVAGLLDFACGVKGTLVTSFDVRATEHPHLEVYGTEGSLSVPDPDKFGGAVRINRGHRWSWGRTHRGWETVPCAHGYGDDSRGIGAADMAHAIVSGRPHRASVEMAYHVLDVALAFFESFERGRLTQIESTCERPVPLPEGLPEGILDG